MNQNKKKLNKRHHQSHLMTNVSAFHVDKLCPRKVTFKMEKGTGSRAQ